MRFVWLILITLWLAFVLPTHTAAQTAGLRVTLRDSQGRAIANAVITVTDTTGTNLATATTNESGNVMFPSFTTTLLRIRVSGQLADGTPITQLGEDAGGILFVFDTPTAQLDLRTEPDGTVLPDPATMLALDTPAATPTQAIQNAPYREQLRPTMTILTTTIPTTATMNISAPIPQAADPIPWTGWLAIPLLVLLSGLCAAALWMRQRGIL